MTRAHWEALCAMRNSINECIPMPSVDSGPLFSPEDGPIYADIAERVVSAMTALLAERDALAAQLAAAEARARSSALDALAKVDASRAADPVTKSS